MLVHSSMSLLFCFIPSQLERHVIPGLLSLYSNILFLLIRWKSGTRRTTMDMLMGKGKGRPSFCCCFGRCTGGRSPLLLGARSSGHRKRRGGRQRRRRCRRRQHPGEGKGRVGHVWSSAS